MQVIKITCVFHTPLSKVNITITWFRITYVYVNWHYRQYNTVLTMFVTYLYLRFDLPGKSAMEVTWLSFFWEMQIVEKKLNSKIWLKFFVKSEPRPPNYSPGWRWHRWTRSDWSGRWRSGPGSQRTHTPPPGPGYGTAPPVIPVQRMKTVSLWHINVISIGCRPCIKSIISFQKC